MTPDGQLYIAQMRAHFALVTDPILCRSILGRRAMERGHSYHHINAWDSPRRSV